MEERKGRKGRLLLGILGIALALAGVKHRDEINAAAEVAIEAAKGHSPK